MTPFDRSTPESQGLPPRLRLPFQTAIATTLFLAHAVPASAYQLDALWWEGPANYSPGEKIAIQPH